MDPDHSHAPTYHLRRVVDHVPSMLAYWDSDLRCRFANRAYETWFGVNPERLIGTSIRDLLGADLYALNEAYILGALAGRPQSFERMVPGVDGMVRYSLAQYTPDVVGDVVVGFVACVTEVTQLKKVEEERNATIRSLEAEIRQRRDIEDHLEDTQQSLAVTLASIDAGFIATDREGRVVRMNSVSEQMTGWSQTDARGRSLWDVFMREDRPPALLSMNPVSWLEEQEFTVGTAHHVIAVAQDGTRRPLEVKAALTYAADGTVRGLAMVMRDVTRAWQAQMESNRLAAIVDSSSDAIISKTLDGRITGWNAAAQALFGYTADEALGRPVQMLIPEDRQHEEMAILASLARGVRVQPFETARMAKDGHLVDVSISISPIRDAVGRVAGASKIVRDITQLKEAKRLDAENRQIQEASRLKSQFLANMSHELRTPLNAIIGFSELLHSGAVPADSPKCHTFLGHIASSGRHLLQLINDVLDLSKVESGKFEFFAEPINLPKLIGEVGDILHTSIDRKRISFSIEVDPDISEVHLDAGRLKQVLYNYLSNAIKFTLEDGRVSVRARAHGVQHFILEVEDNGVGVAPAEQSRLFTEFQQLGGGYAKQHEGTGLGLALTRRLVEAQGGRVGVVSEPGRGSVFHALLNRVHGTDAAPAIGDSKVRLLVIEDDHALQSQSIQVLTDAGFHVTAAGNAEEATRLARAGRFDGLTLDLRLPDRPGLGLLAGIRDDRPNRTAPVLGMTVQTNAGTAASFAISDILRKPIRTDEMTVVMAPYRVVGNGSVMVIDDDAVALALMRATLQAIGIDAVCLQDGRQALNEIERHRPQAIILDLMMPGFDGFEVLDALHRLPKWRETPVFIWTSMILTEDEYATLSRSALAILTKGGGDLTVMLERVRRWRPLPAL
jgi:PAS domain S-box-containing protein